MNEVVEPFSLADSSAGGPGGPPQPWIVMSPNAIGYLGSVLLPTTVAGGPMGAGTINAIAYFVNGVPLVNPTGNFLPLTGGTLTGGLIVQSDVAANSLTLGDVSTFTLTGGATGQVLQTDGTGTLFWGNAGAQGPPGAQGPIGPQGPTGVQGPQGPIGPEGIQGIQGDPGEVGTLIGSFGNQTTPADLPPNGLIFADFDGPGLPPNNYQMQEGQGLLYTVDGHIFVYVTTAMTASGWVDGGLIQGPQGIQGDPGAQGPIGATGPIGPEGPAGIQGPVGPNGPPGLTGPQGIEGPEGPEGAVGAPGAPGTTGPTGPTGPQGPEGPQGIQGDPGQIGILIGEFTNANPNTLPPDGLIPANFDGPGIPLTPYQVLQGQGLLYTVNQHIFIYVTTAMLPSGWVDAGAIEGPEGPQGPQGVDGATGPQGPPGVDGPTGPAGPIGPQGIQGIQGIQGPQGDIGLTGPAGPIGPPGSIAVDIDDNPPTGPVPGDLWFDSINAQLFIWYEDPTSAQWVIAVNQPAPAIPPLDFLPLAGGTLTGPLTLSGNAAAPLQAVPLQQVLPLIGGVMTGPITLAADPIAALQASTKQYVDAHVINSNRIINGDMRIDQHRNGASGINGVGSGYIIDRWQTVGSVAAKYSVGRNLGSLPTPPGFPYTLGFLSSSAYVSLASDYFYFCQPIEADMVSDFAWGTTNAQPVTLSFWAFSSLTGTFTGAIVNTGGTRSYPFTYLIPVANTPTKITVIIPGEIDGTWVLSGNSRSMTLIFDLGSGSTFRGPANAWASANYVGTTGAVSIVATNGATFYVTGVKLEIGNIATPFNRQSMAKSLADCQRYYIRDALLGASSYVLGSAAFWNSSMLPTTMRAVPTMTVVGSSFTNCSTPSIAPESSGSFYISALATITSGATWYAAFTADAEL